MTVGTIFTLFVVPSVYVLIAKDHHGEGKVVDLERGDLSADTSDSALDPAVGGV
jgi:hypothetical protein